MLPCAFVIEKKILFGEIIFFLLLQEKRKHYFEKCPACIQKHFMRRPL